MIWFEAALCTLCAVLFCGALVLLRADRRLQRDTAANLRAFRELHQRSEQLCNSDTARLDWLGANCNGEPYWRVHLYLGTGVNLTTDPSKSPNTSPTPRAAIDAAMEAEAKGDGDD